MRPYQTLSACILFLVCTLSPESVVAQSDQLSLHALFGADALAQNVNAVRRRAADLPLDERYESLEHWVLPSQTHPDYRMTGEFVPTDPSPLAIKLEPYRFPSERGGELVSPVFDLLEAAQESGRLNELFAAVNRHPDPLDPAGLRAKRVLQLLISMESGKETSQRDKWVSELYALTVQSFSDQSAQSDSIQFWPELFLIDRTMHIYKQHVLVDDMLSVLYNERMSVTRSRLLQSHLHSYMSQYQVYLRYRDSDLADEPKRLTNWIPVTQSIAMTRGEGYPQTLWTFDAEDQLTLASGKNEAYLFFRSPLAGDYEVVAEMADAGISQILVGGQFLGTQGDGKRLISGTFRGGGKLIEGEYPVGKHDPTIRYRAKVKNLRTEVSINGNHCFDYPLDSSPDPWLALRSMPTNGAVYRDLVVTGTPTIPDSIDMLSSPTLTNWLPYYLFSDSAGTPQSRWEIVDDPQNGHQLIGKQRGHLAGSSFESLLRYHRPLAEDGSIEYDFVYSPGRYEAHPVLDRMAFLIEPGGVRLHWMTDGKIDRTQLPPDNAVVEPGNRRGPDQLPLNENTWNHLKLSIVGQVISLELNQQVIYERKLEIQNQRTFGLFHYSDRSDLQVRRVTMRGAWPKTLPTYYEQELADPRLADIERSRKRLVREFRHDFVRDGLPGDFFELKGPNAQQAISASEDGIHIRLNVKSGSTSAHLLSRFSVSGDFDIQAGIELREMDDSLTYCLAFLGLRFDDELQHYVRSMAGADAVRKHTVRSQVAPLLAGGRRSFLGNIQMDQSLSGRLRIARRGQQFDIMFAPEDSEYFRIIESLVITDADVLMNGILLQLALNGQGSGHVVWKDFSIDADRIKYLAPDRKPTLKLFSMSPDGGNLRQIAEPKFDLDHLGSPEFSGDGSRIVMDMSSGGTTTSHVVIMNRDGSEMKDLGMGCMPSLSKDGKSIVFSDPGAGIVRMDADGKNRKTLERSGWGVQYSPDGKHIAYGSSSNITLIDPKTEEKTPLLEGDLANRYSRIYWNFGWSHDSQSIAFKGSVRATGQQELAVVDINKPTEIEVLHTGTGIYEDFTFSPDNLSVLFALRGAGTTQPDLYLAHREKPGQIDRFDAQPADYRIVDCDWSPDGKEIVFAALVDPVPVDWPLEQTGK